MSDIIEIIEDVTIVQIASDGPQGPQGPQGATGATGSSGVVTVNAPITNSGTSTAADLSISSGSTSAAGILQLTDSVASTSTTTAATPNAVKTANDLAAAAQSRATFTAAWDWLYSQSSTNIDTLPRLAIANSSSVTVNGAIVFVPVVPIRDFTVTNVAIHCVVGATDSGGTTVRKLGIYTLSGTTMTLQRATANDSTIGNTSGVLNTRALTSTYAMTAGTTYYVAVICYNTGGTFNSPAFASNALGSSSLASVLPQMAFRRASQTDLGSSVDVTTVSANATYWMRLT